jgi:D-alanine-D-alanine ligase
VAKSIQLFNGIDFNINTIGTELGFPCFVKPNQAGSSFGISKVYTTQELPKAIEEAFKHDSQVLIESFLSGREVTCGVLNFNGTPKAMPITEIITDNDFFDFEAKYKGESKEITPANLPEETTKKVQQAAIKVFQTLSLKGVARVDFIIMDDEPFMIEANTVPGLSSESLIPQQAEAMGFSLPEFFTQWVEFSLQ